MTGKQKRLLHIGAQVFVLFVFLFFHVANLMSETMQENPASGIFGIGFILLIQSGFHFGAWALVHYNVKVHEH